MNEYILEEEYLPTLLSQKLFCNVVVMRIMWWYIVVEIEC